MSDEDWEDWTANPAFAADLIERLVDASAHLRTGMVAAEVPAPIFIELAASRMREAAGWIMAAYRNRSEND